MALVVLYDANVLYGSVPRDLLIRVAQAGLVQAKWTHEILDETFRNLKANRPDLDSTKLDRTRDLMIRSIRACLVEDYEPFIDGLKLPDPGDRHVLAAAIKARAQVIGTDNLKHFPQEELGQWDIEAKDPDTVILDQIYLDRAAVFGAIQLMANACANPPRTACDILNRLENHGLVESVAELRS